MSAFNILWAPQNILLRHRGCNWITNVDGRETCENWYVDLRMVEIFDGTRITGLNCSDKTSGMSAIIAISQDPDKDR